jgi:tetraacyldisaccharide-1-P 4'-kinase
VDLVLIQTGRFPSESFTFPLGLLRESFSSLEKASAVLLLEGENLQSWQNLILEFYPSIPLFTAKREYFGFWNEKGQQTIQGDMGAFCGIAFPPAFLKAVAERGSLKYHKAFPDHFSYDVATVSKLIEEGKRRNIQKWITTEKDWFKVGPLFEKLGMMEDLSFLKSGIKLQDSFWEFLREHIND